MATRRSLLRSFDGELTERTRRILVVTPEPCRLRISESRAAGRRVEREMGRHAIGVSALETRQGFQHAFAFVEQPLKAPTFGIHCAGAEGDLKVGLRALTPRQATRLL